VRIALYSHDAQGLGHLRRNLAIAGAVAPAAESVLLVTGLREAAVFDAPPGVDVLTLPGWAKDAGGGYRPRSLGTSAGHLATLRTATLHAALEAYAPDVLVVDKHPLGLGGELIPALRALRELGTRCVLGLRDVLDRPDVARAEWRAAGAGEAVREHFDDVLVYGDPAVYDVVRECRLGEDVERRARFTGYLAAGRPLDRAVPAADGPYVLGLVGAGQDGVALADAFARAPMPAGRTGVLVTGPHMPAADRVRLRRAAGPRVEVLDFVPGAGSLVRGADAVVSMGGYNTVCELLAAGRPALLVPRVAPREEQLIRGRVLARRGVLDLLHPAAATPRAVGTWLAEGVRALPRPRGLIDLNGLDRLPALLTGATTHHQEPAHAA
jgi:predicted glycosyltransferase